MAVPSKIPAFFKCFIPDMSSHRLRIPSAFISYMKGKLPNSRAFLRDRCGNIWPVGVVREGNNLYFGNGWLGFVEDNGVELGDVLVFQFDGNCFFNFKHLGKTACEKEIVGPFNFTVKEEEEVRGEANHEEEEEEEEEQVHKVEDEGEEDVKVKKNGTSMNLRSKGKVVAKDEGDRRRGVGIFESGLIAPPKNPYFIFHVKQMKRNELYIPVEVIRDHNLDIPGEIIIHGEDGKEFDSRINTWGDGRKRVTNGWRAFCRWNFVKEDDTCLCEFLTSQKLLIRVLDFQAEKWMSRPRR